MTTPTLTPPPDAPDRLNQTQPAFSAAYSAFLSWIKVFAGEIATAITWIAGQVTQASTHATNAGNSAGAAAQSETNAAASAAAAASVAPPWASGGSFTAGETVYSPVTLQTYRARTDHSGLTTDPSTDAANWQLLGADAEAIAEDIKSAVSDAYHFAMIAGA